MTALARQLRRAGVGADQELAGIENGFAGGQQHVGPDVAGDKIHIVLFHQFVGFLLADFGLETVVLKDDLDVPARHFAAEMFHRQVHRVFHVLANHPGRGGQRGHKTNLDAVAVTDGGHQLMKAARTPAVMSRIEVVMPVSCIGGVVGCGMLAGASSCEQTIILTRRSKGCNGVVVRRSGNLPCAYRTQTPSRLLW